MSKTTVTKKINVPAPENIKKAKPSITLKPVKVKPKAKHDLIVAPQFGDVVEGDGNV